MSGVSRHAGARVCLALPIAVAAGAVAAGAGELAAVVVLAALCALALVALVRRLEAADTGARSRDRVLRWTLGAFAGHLLLSIVINAAIYSESDAHTYHNGAVDILRHWGGGFPGPQLPQGKEGYYYLLAAIFWLFGPNNLAGLVVNATFSAALVPVVTDLTRRLLGEEPAGYVPQLVVLLPGLLLWTSQLLKEPPIILLVAVCLNAASRLLRRQSVSGLIMIAAGLAVLFTMRSHVALMMAMGMMLGIALGRPSMLTGVGTGLSVVALIAILVTATGVGYSGYKAATGSNLKQANLVRQDLVASANSGFGADIDISTPGGALSNLPYAGATFLLGPFPWQLHGGRQLIALPDVFAWWFLLPSLWRGLRAGVRRTGRGILILVLPALTTTALLSLVVGNLGTVVRERSQVVIMVVPILALGLAQRRSPRVPGLPAPRVSRRATPQAVGAPVG